MRNSIVECHGLIFNSIEHNKFQSLEILISDTITRINNKQQIRHDKILNNARNSILSNHMPTDNEPKLVCNISNVTLTDTQQHVLSKGLNFAVTPKFIPKFEIIKEIESTYRLEPEKLNEFKANIKKTIDKHKIRKGNLSSEEIKSIQELQKNKNIVISRADKGNVVVVQNKQDYERNMLDILSGEEYSQLDSDPTKGVENKVTAILKKAVCL
jgi:hypothetical protein